MPLNSETNGFWCRYLYIDIDAEEFKEVNVSHKSGRGSKNL